MITPRIEIDLAKIEDNARSLVTRLAKRGIRVTGVTKATLGSPDVARAMVRGGVTRLADSRIENLEALQETRHQGPAHAVARARSRLGRSRRRVRPD